MAQPLENSSARQVSQRISSQSTDVNSLAEKTIKSGGIIVYPTDTLYGFGGDATNSTVINKIYNIKKRRGPISVLVSNITMAFKISNLSEEEKNSSSSETIIIKSPLVGTFYISPKPDSPPFISKGDKIIEGQIICIIEAMKIFNEIESEFSGTILEILVKDATPVEYDQELLIISPD